MNKLFKLRTLLTAVLLTFSSIAYSVEKYPKGPDSILTPGEICQNSNTYRYPEKIKYCNRDVSSEEKKDIIAMYDRERNFVIQQMNRYDFKIDHYIPLCMGGSNGRDNLWPQHKTIYDITDKLESGLCGKLASGSMTQSQAIELVKKAKNDLKFAKELALKYRF